MISLNDFKNLELDYSDSVYGGANETSSTAQCTTSNNDCKQVDCTDTCDRDELTCEESEC